MEIFGQQVTWIEIAGTVFGIVGVWLTLKKNSWCFPAGLVNVGLYAVLFYDEKLYADAALQLFYIGLLIYGWRKWHAWDAQKEFITTTTGRKLWIQLLAVNIASTIVIGTFFMNYTDASLPYLDLFLTSMSLIAQWMIAKKKIENWLVWIVADIAYVGMYLFKHLYLTAGLYFIFIVLAVFGYKEWKKNLAAYEKFR